MVKVLSQAIPMPVAASQPTWRIGATALALSERNPITVVNEVHSPGRIRVRTVSRRAAAGALPVARSRWNSLRKWMR